MSQPMKSWILRVHKWVGICLGLVIFIWLLSGIVMLLPPGRRPSTGRGAVDYARATISPARAVELASAAAGSPIAVRRLSLVPLLDRDYYVIEARDRKSYLLDSQSGEVATITAELAERVAREAAGGNQADARVELVSEHGAGYNTGPLPAYRVTFDDGPGTVVGVSLRDGSALYSDRGVRARVFVSELHTFEPLRSLPAGARLREPLLYAASLVGFGLVLTGYYMAFPRLWRASRGNSRT